MISYLRLYLQTCFPTILFPTSLIGTIDILHGYFVMCRSLVKISSYDLFKETCTSGDGLPSISLFSPVNASFGVVRSSSGKFSLECSVFYNLRIKIIFSLILVLMV